MGRRKLGTGQGNRLYFVVEGLTPMLMHNAATMKIPGLHRPSIPTPEEEAAESRYLLSDGNFGIPAIAVRTSILNGAKGLRSGRSPLKPILSGAITTEDEWFPLLRNGKPIIGSDYTIDTRRVVIQRQGVLRSRPKIELPWEIGCVFGFNPAVIPDLEVIRVVLQKAGIMAGLLDYRPERGGWFGKYTPGKIWVE